MSRYTPPFHITDKIINLLAEISEQFGRINTARHGVVSPKLRRQNRIRTIHSSLAIEQNSLSLEQVTAILNGKRVLGRPDEIREVRNAYTAYELMLKLNPFSVKDMLAAHRAMMEGLIAESGKFRSGGVGVFNGKALVHMAPPAELVQGQIKELIQWYKKSDMHPLLKSAVFHYEFEFIHPFADGNGRIGRMWHSLLLGKWNDLFFYLPVEDLIRAHQNDYYDRLGRADKEADSSGFVEFMLEIIRDSLHEFGTTASTDQDSDQDTDQDETAVKKLLDALGDETLSASELMQRLGLSHKPTFRKNYLRPALKRGLIEATLPDKPTSRYQKYRKIGKGIAMTITTLCPFYL